MLNVWTTDLPAFDGDALDTKYAGLEGRDRSAGQIKAWEDIGVLADRFRKATLVLLDVPMWNSGIPYRLKHLIDAISQKDVLFSFDERGLNGLLGGRRAVVINSRGVGLGPDFPRAELDHQQSYMELDHAARTEACAEATRLGVAV